MKLSISAIAPAGPVATTMRGSPVFGYNNSTARLHNRRSAGDALHSLRRWLLVLFALSLVVMLPTGASAAEPVAVSKPWFRYIVPNVPASGYMTLRNQSSSPAVLTGAASPACSRIMVHRSESKSGTETMSDVPNVTISGNGALSFAPGGYHLMCMQPKMKPGEQVTVTLTFQDSETVSATFPVFSVNQKPNP